MKQRFARPLTLVAGPGARVVVTPKELGATPDIEKAVNLAGRVQRPGFVVPLKVEVSRAKVERLVASLGKRFHRDPVDATLKLRNLTPFATKDVSGRRLKEVIADPTDRPRAEDAAARRDGAPVRAGRRRGDERRRSGARS